LTASTRATHHRVRFHLFLSLLLWKLCLFLRGQKNAFELDPTRAGCCTLCGAVKTCRYEGVAADITAWLPKLKRPGGVFLFNDYDDRPESEVSGGGGSGSGLGGVYFSGVAAAVQDFARAHGREVLVGTPFAPPGPGNAAVLF